MKLRLFFFLFFICCSIFHLSAQFEDDFKFSEVTKKQYTPVIDILPLESGNVFVVRGKRLFVRRIPREPMPASFFELLDKDLNLKKTVGPDELFSNFSDGQERKFHSALVLDGKTIVFYSKQPNYSSISLFAAELKESKMVLSSAEKLIAVFDKKNKQGNGRLDIFTSKDKERLVCVFREKVKDKEVTGSIDMVVLNNKLEKQWASSLLKPVIDFKMSDYSEILIKDNGEVFVLEEVNSYQKNLGEEEDLKFEFIINKFDAEGEKSIERTLSSIDQEVRNLHLSLGLNDDILVTGFYSNKAKGEKEYGGVVYLRFDTALLEPVSTQMLPLEPYLTEDGPSDFSGMMNLNGKNKRTPNRYLKTRGIIHQQDGTVILIAEKHSQSYSDAKTDSKGSFIGHFLRDIILIKFNADGTIAWKDKIVKNQFYEAYTVEKPDNIGSLGYASFTYATKANNIYLFYNDHPANLEFGKTQKDLKRCPNSLKSNFCVVSVNQSGLMEKRVLFSSKDKKIIMNPAFAESSDGGREQLILLSRYGNKESFVRYPKR